jgi:hypothetical protein
VATILGALVGVTGGGVGGFGAGAWYADRYIQPAELQWNAAFLGLAAGASLGSALIIWLFLKGAGLDAAGLTAVVFAACVPVILSAPLLWELGVRIPGILVTILGLTLLASGLSRAAAVRLSRSDIAYRAGIVAIIVWIVGLGVWTAWVLRFLS